jgi:hypothetical protein
MDVRRRGNSTRVAKNFQKKSDGLRGIVLKARPAIENLRHSPLDRKPAR